MKNKGVILIVLSGLMAFIGYHALRVKDDYFSMIPMILLALPAYFDLLRVHLKKGLLLIAVLSVYATCIEALSIVTSFPYGSFNYNAQLGYKLFDLVPWGVGFGWGPLVIGAFALGTWNFEKRWVQFAVGAGLLVFTDLILDPGAVLMNFWTWADPGVYYSIPVTNYLGWGLSAMVGGLIFYKLIPNQVIQKLSVLSILTLSLGNAFWIGVTLSGAYWMPFLLGVLLQGFVIYTVWIKFDKGGTYLRN